MSAPNSSLHDLLSGLKTLSTSLRKSAFIPMPPDMQQPQQPGMPPGGAPPPQQGMPPGGDPSGGQMQQVDPAAMQQQAMAQSGGMPPTAGGPPPQQDPNTPPEQADQGPVIEQIVAAVQSCLQTLEEFSKRQDELEQQMQQLAEQHQTLADSLAQPAPMDGAVQGAMGDMGGMPPGGLPPVGGGGMGADGGQPMAPQGQPM